MMNKSKTVIFLIVLFLSICEMQGADLYWRVTAVNNNFNNAANWTNSPTGVGGTSPGTPPTILDNVYFTNTSNYMDIKPTGTGNMRNLTVTAAGYKFSQNNINIAGSIALDGTFQITVGTVYLLNNSSPTDVTIDFGTGNKIVFGSKINIDKPGVKVRLVNNKLNTSASIELVNTSFYSDGFDIEVGNFSALAATSNRTINLNGSTLTTTINSPGLSSARSQFFANYTTFELDECDFVCNNEMIVLTGVVNVTSTIRFKTITFKHYIETVLCASYISDASATNTYNWNLTAEKFIIETPSLQIRPLTNERARISNLYITDEINFPQKGIITINSSNVSNPTNLYINDVTTSASGCGNMSVIQANTPTNFEATGAPIFSQNVGYRGITFLSSGSSWTVSEAENLGGNSGNITWTTGVSKSYYWIGGSGSWDDPAHWAFSSGGFPNSDGCVPGAIDNVIVDDLSFTAVGQKIYLEASAGCKNLTWIDTHRWGSLTISNDNTSLTINGNADFSGVAKNGIYPTLYFNGSGSQTITSAADTTYSSKNIYFAGTGTYTLANDFTTNSSANTMAGGTCGSHIFHHSGGFVSGGKTMDIGRFESTPYPSGTTRSLNFSNSNIKACFNSGSAGSSAVPVITLDNTGMNSYNFAGSHLILNSSGQTTNNYCILSAPGIVWTFNNISFVDPNASIRINTNNLYTYMANISKLTIDGHAVFTYGFKTDSLILSPSKTYTLTSGRPIEINKYMTTRSNGCNITEIKATSGTGILKANYSDFKLMGANISRINASGSPLTVYGGIDGGNNLNVTINSLPPRSFYWVGGSGNWSDPTHWSIGISGGNPVLTNSEGCLPADLDSVFFDANSFTATGQTVSFDLASAIIGTMIWTPEAGAKNPVFITSLSNINITLNGSLEWAEQMSLKLQEGSVIAFAGVGTTANSQYLKTNNVAPPTRCIDYSFSGGGRYDVLGHINNACTLRLSGTTSSLYTNSYAINLKSCYLTQGASGTVDLGSSYVDFYTTNVVNSSFTINNCANFHAENATISAYAFTINNNCGGVTFNKLNIGYRLIASSASNTINARSITIQEGQGVATLINGKFVADTVEFMKSPSTHTLQAGTTLVANDTIIGYATPCAFIDLRSTDVNPGGQTASLKTSNCGLDLLFFRLTNITGLNDGCPTKAFNVIGNDLGGNTNITFEIPPSGTLQFADTIVACQSLPYLFNPEAPGVPVSYQWFKNGIADPSETGPTYTAFEAGLYRVVVTYTGVGCANAYEQRLSAVIDTIKPQISQLADTTIVSTTGVSVVFSGNSRDPQVFDNCFIHNIWYSLSGATVADSVKANSLNGVVFNEGVTTVIWHASDSILPTWYITTPSATNIGTSSFNVLVIGPRMKKKATLNGVMNNGSYANPVSVLFNENIEYELTVVNESLTAGSLIIRDTLPPYLSYVVNSVTTAGAVFTVGQTSGPLPLRDVLTWNFVNVPSLDTRVVEYEATPQDGVCASQPMFINRASVVVGNTLVFMTNASYHQGAGVGVATFSSGREGVIYNAASQVVDYKTSLRSGIVIAPDEGYLFSGWSHDDYVSLRGEVIPAEKGIMRYDTLTVYGDVELHADFEPEIYPIRYYMNNSDNPEDNPLSYTIESETIILETPVKPGDAFVGWTGSNGDVPQTPVTISRGETGERVFYANFLYSGRERIDEEITTENKDRIWAAKGSLYVESSKPEDIIKIYSMDGVLQQQCTIHVEGLKEIKLNRGIYIVIRNNDKGEKVRIE